ncbi:lipocalin family protein [Flavobacterium panacagri]|uniref:lipocalin family protein n=1 Tax=Flavobacterium panacagri TaxID=3034146 RepID=UPI0025A58C97|nr:lipocalin family protein [Flavobacterium panacagri]
MKRILLAAFLIVLASCSDSSELIPDDTSGDINGVWILKAEYEGIRLPLSDCRLNENIAFEDNSVIMVKAEETGNSGCTLTTVEGIFSKTGTSLSIELTNEKVEYKIKELTKTKLYLIPANSTKAYVYERAE